MKKVIEKRKDIAFLIKLYPLPMHKDAKRKSESIICSRSLQMLEDALANKPIPDPNCKTDVIDKNIKLAEKLGIRGTPTIILNDGRVTSGAMKAEDLIGLIEAGGSNSK
jgi:thiol:disulfide interchange protein DsbC